MLTGCCGNCYDSVYMEMQMAKESQACLENSDIEAWDGAKMALWSSLEWTVSKWSINPERGIVSAWGKQVTLPSSTPFTKPVISGL